MQQSVREILDRYRDAAKTQREKGTYFEQIVRAYLQHDPMQQLHYEDVWTYADWASQQGLSAKDDGIDLVAKIRGEDRFCAIQCKFFSADTVIQRKDIDSFLAISSRPQFGERLIVDSTNGEWGANAEAALFNQSPPARRIGITDLEDSPIDWAQFVRDETIRIADKKTLLPHQKDALAAVRNGFSEHDRGKLIMACGTGKTFTGLKIAEDQAGVGKTVLFMVPSLALMSQSVREWTNDSGVPLRCFAVCSDAQVGKRQGREDFADIAAHDLAYPATTNAKKLAEKLGEPAPDAMTVVFSTYQSIDTISAAQFSFGMGPFDLIICDEAHRTTGAKFEDEEESSFTKIHSNANVEGSKRLYMTATPRVYGESVRQKAEEASVELCSMDSEELYGPVFFTRGFSWAVEKGLLTDYKVIVLAVDEKTVASGVQNALKEGSELKLDDVTKIIGCYKALIKRDLTEDVSADPQPMRRALAFCRDIKTSKLVTRQFEAVVDEFLASEEAQTGEDERRLRCELDHVDGTFNAKHRETLLKWLKADTEGACRILSNARCLSEGVDVPALDAILFLHPRKSQIDVVQSVGRVMRRAPGKKMGYVILPVAIPSNESPDEALNRNERYQVVWQILNALRSHDDRLDATINRMEFGGESFGDKIEIVAVSNSLPSRVKTYTESIGLGHGGKTADRERDSASAPEQPSLPGIFIDEFAAAIMAKIVKKCGRRTYWEDWAGDIGKIAQTHITRIKATISQPGSKAAEVFASFLAELRDDLNPSITEDEAVEMIAQHIITQPVFDALFEKYSFAKHNPVSRMMDKVLEVVHPAALTAETETLDRFYDSVRRRAAGVDTAEAKQKIIVQLYDSFFRNAFPKMTERLGIVYTPVEVVDFIIHSVNEALQSEFGQTLGSKGVHIVDPFTGTGTFITRLLQSGLIKPEELERKYRNEIHANEMVLLAYYIAAINIEAAYHGVAGGDYLPFEGICLTDTFQLYEQERDLISGMMADNSSRRTRQKELDIRVIVGNPPYSVGQGSANDNAANLDYAKLDGRIRDTYAARSDATNKNALYDSYIRAIRWASDRIGNAGVVAYVSNAGWVESNTADGLRQCLAEEFANIHVFHLRGNQRTSGERSRREGGKIFGGGSRAPIAITLLVKNPDAAEQGRIRFYDIGDYLTREEKLAAISRFASMGGITRQAGWQAVTPDEHGDWLAQRDKRFDTFIPMGDKDTKSATALFANYSRGLETNRDAWCYNTSREAVASNMRAMIDFYNAELDRFNAAHPNADRKARSDAVEKFIDTDSTRISWNRSLKSELAKGRAFTFDEACLTPSIYRPFSKSWVYYHRQLNAYVNQMPRIFPMGDVGTENQVIMVKQRQHEGSQFALMTTSIPELQTDGGAQCFPEYLYEADAGIAGSDRIGSDRIGSDQFYPPLTEEQEHNLVICSSGGGQKVAFSVLMTNALPSLHMADIDGSQCFPMFLYEREGAPT